MSVAAAVAWTLAIMLFAVSVWLRRQRRRRSRRPSIVPPLRPGGSAAPKPSEALVWINADGTARELTAAEKNYVDTEFSPFDGARPYIKSRYAQRNGWGELSGYVQRKEVPDGIPISPAPPDAPVVGYTPQQAADAIRDLIRKHHPN